MVSEGHISITQVPVLKKARLILNQEGDSVTTEDVKGLWIVGPPGTGKSHYVRTTFGDDLYIKEIDILKNIQCRYIYFGHEGMEEGKTHHLQGFLCFKNARSWKNVKKILHRWHLEVMRGSITQNEAYCSKEHNEFFGS